MKKQKTMYAFINNEKRRIYNITFAVLLYYTFLF